MTHAIKKKKKSALSHPFHLNFMYLYLLGGVPHLKGKNKNKKSFQVQHHEPAVASPRQLLLARWAWLQGIYPSPHQAFSCFLTSPLVFVSLRKMFLPFSHNQRGKHPSLPLSPGEEGGLGNRGRAKLLAYSTVRKWPQESGLPSETPSHQRDGLR